MRLKQLILANLLLFAFTAIHAQSKFNYTNAWKKIDQLINKKGLPESALKEIQTIYTNAKKEKNNAQLIKALIFRISIQQQKEEAADVKTIKDLEKEIPQLTGAAQSIVQSLLAEAYWTFLQNNRWKFYNRTNTSAAFKKEDINTWTLNDLHQKIAALYLASIQNEKLLQQTSLQSFEPIIIKGNMRALRPTLFDLLAHRALDYFENDEWGITKPQQSFEIDAPQAFAAAATFLQWNITSNDAASLHHKALLVLQKLIAFHKNDAVKDALVDVDIRRIEFVNRYSTLDNKNELYRKALQRLRTEYAASPFSTQAVYLLAQDYANYAQTYDFTKNKINDETNPRWYYQKAAALCREIVKEKTESEGKVNCSNLLRQIEAKDVQLTIEQVNLPDLPFRTLVRFKNSSKLWFRIVKKEINPLQTEREDYWDEAYWKKITALKPLQQFAQALPVQEDYQQHTAEIKMPALPSGTYLIIASTDEQFSIKDNILTAQYVHISSIAWLHHQNDFFVLNRNTGAPLAKSAVQIWDIGYDYNTSTYINKKAERYTTDANGYFELITQDINNNLSKRLEITTGNDRLFIDDNVYTYRNDNKRETDEIKNRRVFLFTDRSIYRPGQTVYFKGIITTTDAVTGKPKVVSNLKTKILLFDANYQKADSINVTTNEFGSYSGTVVLPQGGMNGIFRLRDEVVNNETQFSVEEYKRPKFYVDYQPVKESFKVADQIKLTGNAKAYAGNNIDNAIVKYRVVREPRLLYPWLCRRWGWPPVESKEITHGETTTKADGSFEIVFTAEPDKLVRKELLPVFDYKIIADVTDVNGETRTGETTISAGYTSLKLNVTVPQGELITGNTLKELNISTQNMMGAFVKTRVQVSIYKLDAPSRLIRERYWQQPDVFVMSEADYLKDFPNDEYSNETEKENWKRLERVYEQMDTSTANQKYTFSNLQLNNGWYVIEVSAKDKEGNDIKQQAYVQVTDGQTNSPNYVWSLPGSTTAEPGTTATIELGSSAADVFLIEQQTKENKSTFNFLTLNNEQRKKELPVTENDRGGLAFSYVFIKHNRVFTFSRQINVPWTNKELKINFETFRDKTLPGSNEEWKIKISGSKGEKVAAELLASAYDASLDQFKPHQWNQPALFNNTAVANNWRKGGFRQIDFWKKEWFERNNLSFNKQYDVLEDAFDFYRSTPRHTKLPKTVLKMEEGNIQGVSGDVTFMNAAGNPGSAPQVKIRGNASLGNNENVLLIIDGVVMTKEDMDRLNPNDILEVTILKEETAISLYGTRGAGGAILIKTKKSNQQTNNVQIRKNFSETAFFFPQLQTDSTGAVILKFTMPEALTKWKTQVLAHTKDLSTGFIQKETITQKELMVQPFAPRFLREGDRFEFTAKITNLTDKELTGNSQLQFLNAATLQPVDAWFQNLTPFQYFTVAAGQSTVVKFRTEVPFNFNEAVTYRIIAKAANQTDGEEMTLPVLTNRMLVTESLPLHMRGEGVKNFSFTKLLNTNSPTLQHHKFTIEFTSNPVWYAVQALPYMMEYPYECAEQTWNRFYANALATHIVSKMPRIKAVFEQWKTKDTSALLSNLQKNEELKSVLLEETPWVLQAKSEEQQKKNIALLFDMVRMSKELNKAMQQLTEMQSANGGFVWFKGGPDDRYITQYILTSIGHLKQLNAWPAAQVQQLNAMVSKAIPYLDKKLKEDHDNLIKYKVKLSANHISNTHIQYLYMRSFFKSIAQTKGTAAAYTYYYKQAQQYWLQQSRYMQGMIALTLSRAGDAKTSTAIVQSIKEHALFNEEIGMYFKDMSNGYYWYQAPVEAQSLMMEVFSEIAKDNNAVNDLKTWLLKQKQTQNWKTTIATAEACYALLLQGTDWTATENIVEIKAGNQTFSSSPSGGGQVGATEAGTGYMKRSLEGTMVTPQMGNISVKITNNKTQESTSNTPAWGAAYWQYFENLDKITSAATPLQLQKKYFIQRTTAKGLVLEPVDETTAVKVGDQLKVWIELRVDRNMEYVHMKDMRASCMEPVNVLSTYKWQDGLGYYESTKDASTNFFFNWLPKGTYVFEYPVRITHAGTYSAGITSIQCMYAPEFTSHSEGVQVKVVE